LLIVIEVLEPLVIDLPSPIVSRVIRKLKIVALMEREICSEQLWKTILLTLLFLAQVLLRHQPVDLE